MSFIKFGNFHSLLLQIIVLYLSLSLPFWYPNTGVLEQFMNKLSDGTHSYVGLTKLQRRGRESRRGIIKEHGSERAQQLGLMGLSAPRHVASSQTRDWACLPCTGRQILNHWAITEVPTEDFFLESQSPVKQMLGLLILVLWFLRLCLFFQSLLLCSPGLINSIDQYHWLSCHL